MNWLKTMINGFITGASMFVPGVSGGTTAILLGCYKQLIEAAGHIWKKENFLYLVLFVGGALPGLGLSALFLQKCIERFPISVQLLFLGIVAAGFVQLAKELKRPIRIGSLFWGVLGIGLVVGIELLPPGLLGETTSIPLLLLLGMVISIALILPGISTSHLLLVLGLYTKVTSGITALNFRLLIPLALGLIAGVLLLTRPLAFAMNRFPQQCNFMILGFVLASIAQLFPLDPIRQAAAENAPLLLPCLIGGILMIAGFVIMRLIATKTSGKE